MTLEAFNLAALWRVPVVFVCEHGTVKSVMAAPIPMSPALIPML